MKFGDKLIALRKKRGLSQEELAEKLNVSRQSVSKWESNNTYPETEKIVQICNLFNCSMDDLINDKVIDIDQVERKEKSNLNISIDSLLDFITKTIDMFAGMTFTSGLKCVIELFIIACVMAFGGFIVISIVMGLLNSVLSFISNRYFITNFIGSVLGLIWVALTLIVLVHIFKIRYLDYYEQALNEKNKNEDKDDVKNNKVKLKENEKISHSEKVKNVVIRDAKDEPFAFLSILSKIAIGFIKFFALMFNFGTVCTLFAFVVCFVILIPFSFNSMLFFGINVAVFAGIVVTLLLIILLFKFIFNKKVNIKMAIILFVVAVVLGGVGSGIGVLGLKDVEVKNVSASDNLVKFEDKIRFSDNLYINHYGYDVEYVVDETIAEGDIYISTNYDDRLFKVNSHYDSEDGMRGYTLHADSNMNFKNIYDIFIKNLKNNIIVDYGESEFDVITVKANQMTIDKLMNNLSKMYLYEKTTTDSGIRTSNYEYRVEIDGYDCSGKYDALTDTMKIDSRYCKCERRTIDTYKGTKVIYNCESTEEYDDYYDE
ncbi:MAG: helix-turn-helix domain-containing protein [Bacilli bacterium]|nr:helix-turn-helix domain-containing protein [Bacilli bacterium]